MFKIAFEGSSFHGWQQQENAATVQGELKKAFKKLTNEEVNIIGCSRTDAGVHANEYYFNVKTDSTIPEDSFPVALASAELPGQISVISCKEVSADFNARFDAEKKEYVYIIENTKIPSPFNFKRAYHYKYPADVSLMNEAAKQFIGEYDFSAFCASGAQVASKVREIYSASVEKNEDFIIFKVCGNGFLYNMVRIMVGTVLDIGLHRKKIDVIPEALATQNRHLVGRTAPASGLYLKNVFYP